MLEVSLETNGKEGKRMETMQTGPSGRSETPLCLDTSRRRGLEMVQKMFQYSEASEVTTQPPKSSNFGQVIRLRPPEGDPYFESTESAGS